MNAMNTMNTMNATMYYDDNSFSYAIEQKVDSYIIVFNLLVNFLNMLL